MSALSSHAEAQKPEVSNLEAAEARPAVTQPNPETEKSEAPMSTLSLHAHAQKSRLSSLEADAEEIVRSISDDKTKSDCRMCDPSEQLNRPDQKKGGKQRMDLSRLEKKLGPKHIALIHAVKDIDPESPHGRELALIIARLD